MSKQGYKPGDNWIIDDISGLQIRMSESVKTWDGYRTARDWWYPRQPQLDVRGIPETSMRVIDGRPEQPAKFVYSDYNSTPMILESANGTIFKVIVNNAGVLSTVVQPWQPTPPAAVIGGYTIEVSNAGALSTEGADETGYLGWMIVSPNGTVWSITTPSGVITVTAV